MSHTAALRNILAAGFLRGSRYLQKHLRRVAAKNDILALCEVLSSSRGEISGGAIAARILDLFLSLSEDGRHSFFTALAKMNPDACEVSAAAAEYAKQQNPAALTRLQAAVEPPRQELFRRLNMAPGGTAALVEMRRLLLDKIADNPEFSQIDRDMEHLFSSWFNRGFLELKLIEWRTPAHILEKIIAYEAIHEIADWDELRRRLLPEDRRCFGFFHPAMPDEPLIFVEVALTHTVPARVSEILKAEQTADSAKADTAVFYSISKCHRGLRGVSFGNLIIKQVAQKLARELPTLKNFVTLSPMPGFLDWLRKDTETSAKVTDIIKIPDWHKNADAARRAKFLLMPAAAEYFITARQKNGFPADPVARFHLGNGAVLWRVNWLADTSPVRMEQSAGIMVNYRYVLDDAEDNHETYARTAAVPVSAKVRALLGKNTTIK